MLRRSCFPNCRNDISLPVVVWWAEGVSRIYEPLVRAKAGGNEREGAGAVAINDGASRLTWRRGGNSGCRQGHAAPRASRVLHLHRCQLACRSRLTWRPRRKLGTPPMSCSRRGFDPPPARCGMDRGRASAGQEPYRLPISPIIYPRLVPSRPARHGVVCLTRRGCSYRDLGRTNPRLDNPPG